MDVIAEIKNYNIKNESAKIKEYCCCSYDTSHESASFDFIFHPRHHNDYLLCESNNNMAIKTAYNVISPLCIYT